MKGETKQRRDGPRGDITLVPVQAQADGFFTFEHALADDAGVDHGRCIGACFGAGQTEAQDLTSLGKARQPFVPLLVGAEVHQQFAWS